MTNVFPSSKKRIRRAFPGKTELETSPALSIFIKSWTVCDFKWRETGTSGAEKLVSLRRLLSYVHNQITSITRCSTNLLFETTFTVEVVEFISESINVGVEPAVQWWLPHAECSFLNVVATDSKQSNTSYILLYLDIVLLLLWLDKICISGLLNLWNMRYRIRRWTQFQMGLLRRDDSLEWWVTYVYSSELNIMLGLCKLGHCSRD